MSISQNFKEKGSVGALLASGFFVAAGFVTLYDASRYTDIDSKVFPQTIAIVMIIAATISFITSFLRPSGESGFGEGTWWRRLLLVATMLIASAVMPMVGFLPAGAIAFVGGLIAAMHDRWTRNNFILYWGAGAVIMGAFYSLFKFALLVPLP